MKKGKVFVISGPSGVGKGTICKELLEELDIDLSVSMTTRDPRDGEVHGESYFFVTHEEFEEQIAAGGLMEYARIYKNYYGTPKARVIEKLEQDRDAGRGTGKGCISRSGSYICASAVAHRTEKTFDRARYRDF